MASLRQRGDGDGELPPTFESNEPCLLPPNLKNGCWPQRAAAVAAGAAAGCRPPSRLLASKNSSGGGGPAGVCVCHTSHQVWPEQQHVVLSTSIQGVGLKEKQRWRWSSVCATPLTRSGRGLSRVVVVVVVVAVLFRVLHRSSLGGPLFLLPGGPIPSSRVARPD